MEQTFIITWIHGYDDSNGKSKVVDRLFFHGANGFDKHDIAAIHALDVWGVWRYHMGITGERVKVQRVTSALAVAGNNFHHKLAAHFAQLIREALTPEQLQQANAENDKGDPNTCATHDYIDANVCMIDALTECDVELDLQDNGQVIAINEAWDMAKVCRFNDVRLAALFMQLDALDAYMEDGDNERQEEAAALAEISRVSIGPQFELIRMDGVHHYHAAFPSFGLLDVELPPGFVDASYHNDAMPRFERTSNGKIARVWIDDAEKEARDSPDAARFTCEVFEGEETHSDHQQFHTDDWREVLAWVECLN
jgi:hypothetical protein